MNLTGTGDLSRLRFTLYATKQDLAVNCWVGEERLQTHFTRLGQKWLVHSDNTAGVRALTAMGEDVMDKLHLLPEATRKEQLPVGTLIAQQELEAFATRIKELWVFDSSTVFW